MESLRNNFSQNLDTAAEKHSIENAYKILLEENKIILNLCKGNSDIAENVSAVVTEKLLRSKINIRVFLENKSYRNKVYKSTIYDFLRGSNDKFLSIDDFDNVVDVDTDDPETVAYHNKELETYLDELLNPDNLIAIFPNVATRDKIIYIIKGVLAGKNSNIIASELSLTESSVSRYLSKLKKANLGHVYDLFFQYLKDSKFSQENSAEIDFERKLKSFRETLSAFLFELNEKKNDGTLTGEEEQMSIAIQVFLDDKIKGVRAKIIVDRLKERGWNIGVNAVYAMQKKISERVGVPLDFNMLKKLKKN